LLALWLGRQDSAVKQRAIAVLLVALTLFVYLQVRHFDFVNWDDPSYLTENANVEAGLDWSNVRWALTTTHSPYWHPLTWLSHMLDVTMYGMDPGWHHVTSLILHIASTLLLFTTLTRMTRSPGSSAFVAAIFAAHPLHVESVAWLAERKDVLSTFFLFVTIWMYVRYVERPSTRRYAAVVAAYALALMAKPMVVTLPFVLLLLDVWPLARVPARHGLTHRTESPARTRNAGSKDPAYIGSKGPASIGPKGPASIGWSRAIVEKLPLLVLALATSVATLIVQKQVGAVASLAALPLGARVVNALVGYLAYVWKTIWPTHLAAFYPFRTYPTWEVALAAALIVTITIVATVYRKRWPYVFVGWLWYVVTVAPVVGLMQAGEQAMADRFMYVPMVGLLIIVAWGGRALLARAGLRTRAIGAIAVALVAACAVAARAQAAYWADSLTLWQHAARVTDANYVAVEKIGEALRDRGQFDEAAANYEQALRLAPANSPIYVAAIQNSLGLVRIRQGRLDEAESHLAAAVRLNPAFAEAQNNYGNALAAQGKYDDAIAHYRAALAVAPAFTEALVGLGGSLVREGRPDDAAVQYREALRLDPQLPQAHNGLGSAFSLQHRDDEAMAEFTRALELKPDLPSAHLNIAIVLLRRNDVAGARRHLDTALAIDPAYEPARNVLARIR
jgi:tetratricopeptide (TPR) repeat protein